MSLSPLPLINGCLFMDNSTMEVLDTCERAGEYLFIRKRCLAENRSALTFGGGIHLALEYRYLFKPDAISGTPYEQTQLDLLALWFRDHPPSLSDFRTLGLASQLIVEYNKIYYAEPFRTLMDASGKPLIEVPFAHELCTINGITIIYTGRIDLPIIEDGKTWTLDHKTTSIMGDGFWSEQAVSPQHEGYCWALWKSTGTMPAGYVVNAIRTRKPLQRDATGNAPRAKKQRQDIEKDDFARQRVFVNEDRLNEWRENLIHKIKGFLWHYSEAWMPQKKKWCVGKYGRCPYYDVCALPRENRETMLASSVFIDHTWSPLSKERTLNDYLKELEQDRSAVTKAKDSLEQHVKAIDPFEGSEYQ